LTGIHRTLSENAQQLIHKPPDADGGFLVPEPSVKLLPEMISKIGLLDADTIRIVMDAYVLVEQYVEDMVLAGGELQTDMPEKRQIVYLPATKAQFVIEYNQIKAGAVAKAIEALRPYVKFQGNKSS
jgi:hypothetical protein